MEPYEYYKMQHRCTACGNRDAFTMNGRALCAECTEKNNRRALERYHANEAARKSKLEREKKTQDERRANGICIECGKRPVESDKYTRCEVCRSRQLMRYHRNKKRESRDVADHCGLCFKCLKPLDNPESRMCNACAEKCNESLAAARKANGFDSEFCKTARAGFDNNGG